MRGRDLGMIFQEPLTRLNPLMRISEHFSETLKTHDKAISKSEIDRRSLEVLRVMGIPPTRYHAYPHEFSGGMRQRLMIALTLVLRPAFVVADEPTTALDVLVEAQIIRILHDLRAQLPHRAAADHPQPRHHRRGVRPGGGDVRRRDRRDRRRAGGLLPAQAPLHPRAAALDDLAADHGAELHRRRTSRPGRTALGLPLPPPLPRRDEDLRHPAPGRARARGRQPRPVLGGRLQGRPGGRRTGVRAGPAPSGRRSPLPTKPETLSNDRSDRRRCPTPSSTSTTSPSTSSCRAARSRGCSA